MSQPIEQLAERLCDEIASYESVAIAFSGGVDSAVVAKAAHHALGDRAVAVTGTGPALAEIERETAVAVAEHIGIRHLEVVPDELADAGYVANEGDRCYFCKSRLYDVATPVARELGLNVVVNGTNADDLGDYRPGLRAATERHVRSPLAELGIVKADVRRLAALWDLPVWDKPASPCLASRLAPGVEVTAERLARVEQAEAIVRDATGLADLRVRVEAGDLARIEIPAESLAVAAQILVDPAVVSHIHGLGFRSVSLDLLGLRSGNLNALVPLEMADSATPATSD